MAFFKVLLIIIVPFSFGCIPSLKLYLGFKATPSSKKGINVNLYFNTMYSTKNAVEKFNRVD